MFEMNDSEYRNLHIMGAFVRNELHNKPLPLPDDAVFHKMIRSGSKANNSAKGHRKRKFETVAKNDDFPSLSTTNVSNTNSSSSKTKQIVAAEATHTSNTAGASFILPLGKELLHAALESLLNSWSHILHVITAKFTGDFATVKKILTQWRNLLLIYCEEERNTERYQLISSAEQFFQLFFPKFGIISANIKNFIDGALKVNMEIEVLFIFQWSISQFSESNDAATVDNNNDIVMALEELLPLEEPVNTSRFNLIKEKLEKVSLLLQTRRSNVEELDENCLARVLSHPYFNNVGFLNTMDIFRISRGEILCRISDLWRQYSIAWEQLALFKDPKRKREASQSKPKFLSSLETEKRPMKTSTMTSALTTAAIASSVTSTEESQLPTIGMEPTKPTSSATSLKTSSNTKQNDHEHLFEKKMCSLIVCCPCCPSSVKAFQWHRFLEHIRYFHIAGDPIPFNELVATNLQANAAGNTVINTKMVPRDVSTIFVYCRDCGVLCCGKRGLKKHRQHCESLVPFSEHFADVCSAVTHNDSAFTEEEILEIEWYFALVQTYISADLNHMNDGNTSSVRQKLAGELQSLFMELLCLCRRTNNVEVDHDTILQLCRRMNVVLPADAVYLRGQVYLCAKEFISLRRNSSLEGEPGPNECAFDRFQQYQRKHSILGARSHHHVD